MGLYQWANDVLIPKLYYTVNYNGESSSSYEEGYLADMYSWRLGPPNLRQLRVKNGIKLHAFGTWIYEIYTVFIKKIFFSVFLNSFYKN